MRKRWILCTLAFVLLLALTSCGKEKFSEEKETFPVPKMTAYFEEDYYFSSKEPGTYYYVVDERTNVVYICYDYNRQHALTVAMNADGKPMTKDQLLREEEKK